MRIYTTAPYTVNNNDTAWLKFFMGQADSDNEAEITGSGHPWRLVFTKFTMSGSPYNPQFTVSVSGDGLNYDSFENNYPSPPMTDFDPNPAVSANDMPIGLGFRQIGLSLNCSPSNSNMTVDFDLTVEVFNGIEWVPLVSLLSEDMVALGSDSSLPDLGGTNLVTSGLIVMEAVGGGEPGTPCFWTNEVGVLNDCDPVDPNPVLNLNVINWTWTPTGEEPMDFVPGSNFTVLVEGNLVDFIWDDEGGDGLYYLSNYDPEIELGIEFESVATQGVNEIPCTISFGVG